MTCGRCRKEMTFKEYRNKHCSIHYNLCWIDGEDKPVSKKKCNTFIRNFNFYHLFFLFI